MDDRPWVAATAGKPMATASAMRSRVAAGSAPLLSATDPVRSERARRGCRRIDDGGVHRTAEGLGFRFSTFDDVPGGFILLNTEHRPSNANRCPGSHNIRVVPTDKRTSG